MQAGFFFALCCYFFQKNSQIQPKAWWLYLVCNAGNGQTNRLVQVIEGREAQGQLNAQKLCQALARPQHPELCTHWTTYQGPPGAYLALNRWGPSTPDVTKPRTFWVLWGQIDMAAARFCDVGSGTHLLPSWPLLRGAWFEVGTSILRLTNGWEMVGNRESAARRHWAVQCSLASRASTSGIATKGWFSTMRIGRKGGRGWVG